MTFFIGLLVGTSLGVLVMGLFAAGAYQKGADDALVAIGRRRREADGWRHA